MFGIKAALFPLYFWLPDSYPIAPSAVTAILAGLLTKVGVYAILRTQTLMFPPDSRPATLILVIAGATMIVGVLGAIAQDDVRRIFSFYIVSQIGYIIMGLGLFTVAGLAGAVFAIVHHIVVKTTLFLVGGLIEHAGGSSRLHRLGGLVASAPLVAVLFMLPALSLAGIPPFSGFAAKFGLFDATAGAEEWPILAVAVLVSLLTLFSLAKIWLAVFWGPTADRPGDLDAAPPTPRLMVLPTAVLAALTLLIGVGAGPLYDLSDRAAAELLDPSAYREAVLRAVRIALLRDRLGDDLGAAVGLGVAGQRRSAGSPSGGCSCWSSPGCAGRGGRVVFRPVAVARLAWHMVVTLVTSNVMLIREVLAPTDRLRTAVIGVPLPGCSDELLTLVNNLVALSPGTMPLELTHGPDRALRPRAAPPRPRGDARGTSSTSPTWPCGRSARPSPSPPRTSTSVGWSRRDHGQLRRPGAGRRAVRLPAAARPVARRPGDRHRRAHRDRDGADHRPGHGHRPGSVPPLGRRAGAGVVHQHVDRRPLHRRTRRVIGEAIAARRGGADPARRGRRRALRRRAVTDARA